MLEKKIKEVQFSKAMTEWAKMVKVHYHIFRTYQIFNREKDMVRILQKMLPYMFLIKMRLRKRVTGINSDFNRRKEIEVKNVMTSGVGTFLRMTMRERAKKIVKEFLESNSERLLMTAKFKKSIYRVIWVQR